MPFHPGSTAPDDAELSSELSELSDSGDDDDDGDDDDPPTSKANVASSSPARSHPINRGGRKPTVWKEDVAEAFDRGLELIPDLANDYVLLKGKLAQRPDLLAEYVRRQTGERRTNTQSRNRISTLRHLNPRDQQLEKLLVGRSVSKDTIDKTDWDALLGVDHFPHIARAPLASPTPPSKKRKRTSTPSAPSKRLKPVPASTVEGSFTSTAGWPSNHPFLPVLAAVFSSYHPTRDHTSTARVLVDLGLDSWDALANLCAFEPSSLERLYEHLRKEVGLGALEVAWVRKAVGAVREGFARGE
ncbi:hypothetical protein JCM8208_007227 [Rhodotorula glutinis]